MDFNSLVNEVLRMAKDSADERKKKAEGNPNISWGDTPAGEAYWKDIRARNTALETGKQTNLMTMARERLGHESAANLADITGRAGIAGDEIKAGAHRYAADQSLEAAKYTANAKDNSLAGLLKPEGVKPQEGVADTQAKRVPGTNFDKPDAVTPTVADPLAAKKLSARPKTILEEASSISPAREGLQAVGEGATWLSNKTLGPVLDNRAKTIEEHSALATQELEKRKKLRNSLTSRDFEEVKRQYPHAEWGR